MKYFRLFCHLAETQVTDSWWQTFEWQLQTPSERKKATGGLVNKRNNRSTLLLVRNDLVILIQFDNRLQLRLI